MSCLCLHKHSDVLGGYFLFSLPNFFKFKKRNGEFLSAVFVFPLVSALRCSQTLVSWGQGSLSDFCPESSASDHAAVTIMLTEWSWCSLASAVAPSLKDTLLSCVSPLLCL